MVHHLDKRQIVVDYISRIKNRAKHDYAWDYYGYVFYDAPEPEYPKGLSYMGAQAVRFQIEAIIANA